MERLRISIGVGGRFHADRMAQALLQTGSDVTLFTTYPASRFKNIPNARIRSCLIAEILFRLGRIIGRENEGDLAKMRWFSRWWGKKVRRETTDVLIGWSSFSEKAFLKSPDSVKILVRDSAHILFQTEHLGAEYKKRGLSFPDRRETVAREMAEYDLADFILLPSEFARRTFIDRGFAPEKLKTIHLGVDTSVFTPSVSSRSKGPLRVVYFGSLSVQKGVLYLLEATRGFSKKDVELTLVGPVDEEIKGALSRYSHAKYLAPMGHSELSKFLREQDAFVLPSIHDGFGLVVPQAMASALVPIVSDHVGAQEIVKNGVNGFIVPAANSDAIRDRIQLLVDERERLFTMRKGAAESSRHADWENYSRELSFWIADIGKRKVAPTPAGAFSTKDKLVHLRQTKLGHLPPAVSAAETLAEASVQQLVVEYGQPSSDWLNQNHGAIPRIKFGDPYNRILPGKLHAASRIGMAFLRLSWRFVSQGRPKLIVAHGVIEQMIAYLLNRCWRVPYVVYVHEVYDTTDVPGGMFKFAFLREKESLRRAQFLIFPSQGRADVYRERYGLMNRYFCVANCPRKRSPGNKVDIRARYKLPSSSFVMGYMGGIGGANGIEMAIGAVARVPDVELMLWGWGDEDYIRSLEALAREKGCASRLHFAGQVRDEKWSLLESCDASLCVYEPKWLRFRFAALASNKFLESLAVGRPVITNGDPDFDSIVSKNKIGIALRELTEEAMVQALEELVKNVDARNSMSANAYQLHATELNYQVQFRDCLEEFRRRMGSTATMSVPGSSAAIVNK